MVSWVPSSGLPLVVELLLLLPPHAAIPSARTLTAAALIARNQSLPDAISSPVTNSAMATSVVLVKDLQFLQPDGKAGATGHQDPQLAGHDRGERDLVEVRCRRCRRRLLVGHVHPGRPVEILDRVGRRLAVGVAARAEGFVAVEVQ